MTGGSLRHRRRSEIALGAIAGLATFVLYLPALRNGFVNWDDDLYVYNNPHIHSLNSAFFRWAFTTFYAANWHPLTWISHAVDYALWGLNPLGHHLTSILLHGLNTFLVVLLVTKLLTVYRERSGSSFPDEKGTLIAAAVTGLLFGIHPIHVESVAWVAERKDLLCAFFYLLSILSYAEHARLPLGQQRPSFLSRSYLLALCFFVLALLSKPMAVSLPLVLLILDWHPFGRVASWKDLRSDLIEKLPFFIFSAVLSVVTIMAQREAIWKDAFPVTVRVLAAARALVAYIGNLLMPTDLLPLYPYGRFLPYASFANAFMLLLAGGAFALSIRHRERSPFLSAVWWYYVVTLLPVLGIVQVGMQSMADRYTYLPSIGPLFGAGIAVAWCCGKIVRMKERRIAGGIMSGAAAVIMIVLALLTVRQISFWKGGMDLWNYVIRKEGEKVPSAYYNRGLLFARQGRFAEAIDDLSKDIVLEPGNAGAYMSRGAAFGATGRYRAAVADLDMAVLMEPGRAQTYVNRGMVEEALGMDDQATGDYSRAIILAPDFFQAYLDRGNLYGRTGDRERALRDCRAACRLGSREACDALQPRARQEGNTGK